MPLLFRKDKTQPVSLFVDIDIEEEKRPAFLCCGITEAEADQIDTAFDEAANKPNSADAVRGMREALCIAVKGWRNMPPEAGEFKGPDSLAILNIPELAELRSSILNSVGANGLFTAGTSGSPT